MSDTAYKFPLPVRVDRLSPAEPIPGVQATLSDFWSWAYSNVLGNVVRSVFAEFVVACALGVTAEPRAEWDAFDLRYKGKGIEVKAAAYLQTWAHREPSEIRFDIAKKRAYDPTRNESAITPMRNADCYVFCLYDRQTEEGRNQRAILDLGQWKFWVVSRSDLDEKFADRKSIGLSALAKVEPIDYAQLREAIEAVVDRV
jgi:hypothetical protein